MLGIHGTKAALERFNKIYPKHTFLRTSINKGKFKIKKDKEGKTIFKRKGLPNLLSDNLMAKVKTNVIGTRTVGTAISRCIVIGIGNGAVKSNNPILLKENGRPLQLTEDWARGVFEIHEFSEDERYNREIRANPTIPFRRKVNFSEENFWCYFLS